MPRSMRWATAPTACALRLRCHRPTPVPDARRPNVCMPSAIWLAFAHRASTRRASAESRFNCSTHPFFVRYCRKSKRHSRKAAGLIQLNKPPNHCVADWACARKSFTPKINLFDTPPETKLFCSAFDAVTEAQASCLTRPAGFQRAGYAKQDDW